MVKVKCGYCFGEGVADCDMEYGNDDHPPTCPACCGAQKVICPICDGKGLKGDEDEGDEE